MAYPGGKGGPGVFQTLINEIPEHKVYVAGFAGFDAIARHKRPAERTILVDPDPEVFKLWRKYPAFEQWNTTFQKFAKMLLSRSPPFSDANLKDWFVFLDPPYVEDSRRSSGAMYAHEMSSQKEHERLMDLIRSLPCRIMLTHYVHQMHHRLLSDWRRVHFTTVDRGGNRRAEIAFCNYDRPEILHDWQFLGRDKREREKLRRRNSNLLQKLRRMDDRERQQILSLIKSEFM